MDKRWFAQGAALCLVLVAVAGLTGCGVDLEEALEDLEEINIDLGGIATPDEVEVVIEEEIGVIQTADPREVFLPVGLEEEIIIAPTAEVIIDIPTQVIIEELPDLTLLGFENITGRDIYIRYLADGLLQGILVFDGETLLLEYPCLEEIELISEEQFDIFTGELVAAFDYVDNVYFNGFDFECGDTFIISFD